MESLYNTPDIKIIKSTLSCSIWSKSDLFVTTDYWGDFKYGDVIDVEEKKHGEYTHVTNNGHYIYNKVIEEVTKGN